MENLFLKRKQVPLTNVKPKEPELKKPNFKNIFTFASPSEQAEEKDDYQEVLRILSIDRNSNFPNVYKIFRKTDYRKEYLDLIRKVRSDNKTHLQNTRRFNDYLQAEKRVRNAYEYFLPDKLAEKKIYDDQYFKEHNEPMLKKSIFFLEEKNEKTEKKTEMKDENKFNNANGETDFYVGENPLFGFFAKNKKSRLFYIKGEIGSGKNYSLINYCKLKNIKYVYAENDDTDSWMDLVFCKKRQFVIFTNVQEFDKQFEAPISKILKKIKKFTNHNVIIMTGNNDYNANMVSILNQFIKFDFPVPSVANKVKILHRKLNVVEPDKRNLIYKPLINLGNDLRFMLNQSNFFSEGTRKEQVPNIFDQLKSIYEKTYHEESDFDSYLFYNMLFDSYTKNDQPDDFIENLSSFDNIKNDDNIMYLCTKKKLNPIINAPKKNQGQGIVRNHNLFRSFSDVRDLQYMLENDLGITSENVNDFNKEKMKFKFSKEQKKI